MVFHIVGGIFAILVGIGLICYAVGKIKESNKKYSLHVEATCIGYHAVEDQIEKDYLEKPTDLSMNGGKKEMEKSLRGLRSPVYQGIVNGKLIEFRGKSSYRQKGDRHEVAKGSKVILYVNPGDYSDYMDRQSDAAPGIYIIFGSLIIMFGIAIIGDYFGY